METHNKEEADRVIREQRLSSGEKLRQSEEFNPGLNPEKDGFGMPGGGEEPRHYPDRYPVASGGDEESDPQLGGTDSDQTEGINVEELGRNVRPSGEPPDKS